MTAADIVRKPKPEAVPETSIPIKISGVHMSPNGCRYLVVYKNDRPKPRWVDEADLQRADLIRDFQNFMALFDGDYRELDL